MQPGNVPSEEMMPKLSSGGRAGIGNSDSGAPGTAGSVAQHSVCAERAGIHTGWYRFLQPRTMFQMEIVTGS